jgi:hypothetical protein
MSDCLWMAVGVGWVALFATRDGAPVSARDLWLCAAGYVIAAVLIGACGWVVRRYRVRIERREVQP